MTVATMINQVQYAGNGSQTVFPYTFKIFASTDLKVYLTNALGVETLLTLTTHYSVSGVGSESGGNVTMVTAPATGEVLTIIRQLPLTQETDYTEADKFPAQSHEDALDRLVMIAQQLNEKMIRCPQFTPGSGIINKDFPSPDAGKYLRWSAGEELENTALLETADSVTIKEELQVELQNNDYTYGASAVGTDAYAITPDPPLEAYQAGQKFLVKADVANTGAATLNVSGKGAVAMRKWKDGALAALETGDILAGQIFAAAYDGAYMVLDVVTQHSHFLPSGGVTRLQVKNNAGTPASQIDIDADAAVVTDGANYKVLRSIDLTVNCAVTGANGLDTGALANNNWYYFWVIAKADGSTAGLASLSASSPAMPSGYTYKKLVSAIRYKTATFEIFYQAGRLVELRDMVSLFSTTSTSWASKDLSSNVPAQAIKIWGQAKDLAAGPVGLTGGMAWDAGSICRREHIGYFSAATGPKAAHDFKYLLNPSAPQTVYAATLLAATSFEAFLGGYEIDI